MTRPFPYIPRSKAEVDAMSPAQRIAIAREYLAWLGMDEAAIDAAMIMGRPGGDLMQDLVRDNRIPSTEQPRTPKVFVAGATPVTPGPGLSAATSRTAEAALGAAGRGWAEPRSLDSWKPPGLDIADAMIDAALPPGGAKRS